MKASQSAPIVTGSSVRGYHMAHDPRVLYPLKGIIGSHGIFNKLASEARE